MFIVGTVTAPIEADARPFQRGLGLARSAGLNFVDQIGSSMQSLGSSLTSFGSMWTKAITLPLAAAGVAAFKFGKDFESEMSKIVGLVGVSKTQVKSWESDILAMSPKIAKTPKELAEAMFFVTSAGLRGAEALDVLKKSGMASASGLGETKTIADLATSAINAYGSENMSAGKAIDIMVAAVREGKAEASEMAASLGAVLPIASEMGVTFDQVAATTASMTKTGTEASEAATALKSILSGLIKPSKQAEEQLKAMGTSSSEMRKKIKEEGLLSALMDLKTLTEKYGEEAMARVFPNIRAFSGALDLLGNNLESNKKTFDAVKNSTGSLDKAFEAASETVDFKWNAALSQLQATAIKAFGVIKKAVLPILENFINVLGFLGDKFSSLAPFQQQVISLFGVMAGLIGPIIGVIGTAIASLGGIIVAVTGAISTLAGIISTVGLPVLAGIVAAIGLIVAAVIYMIGVIASWIAIFVKLWKSNDKFREKVIETWNVIKENAISIFGEIKDFITHVVTKIKDFWSRHGDEIMNIIAKVWTFILDYIQFAVSNLKDFIKIILSILEGDWGSAWESIKDILIRTWEFIKIKVREFLIWLLNKMREKFEEIKETIREKLNKAKENIIEWVKSLPEKILNGLILIKTFIAQKFEEIKIKIKEKLIEWQTAIINWFKSLPGKIVEQLGKWKEALVKWMISQNEENKKQFKKWGNQINTWFTDMKTKIKEKLSEWWHTLKTWFTEMPGKIKERFVEWKKTIVDWFTNMKIKIREKLDEWWNTLKSWFISTPNKKEIKDSGKNIVNKMGDGVNLKKKSFQDKLGRVIVDGAKLALMFAGVALVSTGREIIKRILNGISSLKGQFYSSGVGLINNLISGVRSRIGELMSVIYNLASMIRNFLPFSPAKVGPLSDLDKLNFSGPIIKGLDEAMADINKHFLGNILLNTEPIIGGIGSNGVVFNGPLNFYGVQDIEGFMSEMKGLVRMYGGRF